MITKDCLKETNDFDNITEVKQRPEQTQSSSESSAQFPKEYVDTVEVPIHQDSAWHMGKHMATAMTTTSELYVEVCQSKKIPAQTGRLIHEVKQSDDKSWQNSENEGDRPIDMVNIMSLCFNNIWSSNITKLDADKNKN